MNGAILIIDNMPDGCMKCPLHTHVEWAGSICVPESNKGNLYKHLTNDDLWDRPEWCPLKPLLKELVDY